MTTVTSAVLFRSESTAAVSTPMHVLKLTKRVKIAHLIFAVCVKSVPHYHFKFVYVVLQMVVKDFFKIHF